MTLPQADASPDRALEGPCRPSPAGNSIPPASLSQPACHPTGKPPPRYTRGRSLSRRRGEAAGFRDHFPLALGALPNRAGQYKGTEVFRRLRTGSEPAGGTAGMESGGDGAGRGWSRAGRAGKGRAGAAGGCCYLARGTAGHRARCPASSRQASRDGRRVPRDKLPRRAARC